MSDAHDDAATVGAIAVFAACVATVAHEAIGHGAACLALGGRITQLTNVYFQCSARDAWVAAGGPLGNLGAAALAFAGFALPPTRFSKLRAFFVLLALISCFWLGGYLVYAALLNDGDPYFVAHDWFGNVTPSHRAAMLGLGIAFYAIGVWVMRRFAARRAGPRRLLAHAWIAASLSAVIAACFYAPNTLDAVKQAALEIGAASLPMLSGALIGTAVDARDDAITRDWAWIVTAALVFALFVASLGRGMSF